MNKYDNAEKRAAWLASPEYAKQKQEEEEAKKRQQRMKLEEAERERQNNSDEMIELRKEQAKEK